jgi:hypothetical protein
MSDEVKETVEEKGASMFVHQIDFDTLLQVVSKVTDVNKMFIYNMPNKAEKYNDDTFALINLLNDYIGGEDDWRITKEKNVRFTIKDKKIYVGEWVISGIVNCLCIPKINSLILIPDGEATCNGSKEPTKIIQLTNCIAVTPLLVRLTDEPMEEEGKYNLGLTYEVITPMVNEKPTE